LSIAIFYFAVVVSDYYRMLQNSIIRFRVIEILCYIFNLIDFTMTRETKTTT